MLRSAPGRCANTAGGMADNLSLGSAQKNKEDGPNLDDDDAVFFITTSLAEIADELGGPA